jgi:thioredoxin reductase (NADPH)
MTGAQPIPAVETPDSAGAFPRLSEDQIQALAARGRTRSTSEGEVLYSEGDRGCDFFVVLSGLVALAESYGTRDQRVVGVHGHGRFLGGLGLLTGRAMLLTAVVREPGEVLAVPLPELYELVAKDPALGDLILRAYLIRHSVLIGLGAGLRILGSRFDPDTRRLREFAARNRIPHRWIDLEEDPTAEELLRELRIRPEDTPVVIWRGEQVLRHPGIAELARLIGLPVPAEPQVVGDLVVVGSGPAGLAAAVYGASEGLRTVAMDGVAAGGQAGTSSRIENYLGFPAGISGADLAERAIIQAEKFGAQMAVPMEAVAMDRTDGYYTVSCAGGTRVSGRTVVIATGARYRKLGLPGLAEYEGRSVYYAATEIEALFCAGDPVAVVGGGNSAGQAAVYLARTAAQVRLIVRHSDLGRDMSRYLVDRIERCPAIEVLTETEVRGLRGENGELRELEVANTRTGDVSVVPARALFVFIGAAPHTDWLSGLVALDSHGFVLTGSGAAGADDTTWRELGREPLYLETSLPGVFAAGDVRSGSIKRVASAVGEGAMAVRLVHEHLAGAHTPAGR